MKEKKEKMKNELFLEIWGVSSGDITFSEFAATNGAAEYRKRKKIIISRWRLRWKKKNHVKCVAFTVASREIIVLKWKNNWKKGGGGSESHETNWMKIKNNQKYFFVEQIRAKLS